tara:strand:+ start:116 stop:343 length:228 start_codon:yes stop_codon:yes gene_type:complete
LHDLNALDKLKIPGLLVATTEFVSAAKAQAKSLGFEPATVWVEHPIQNRTKKELKMIAFQAFDSIIKTLPYVATE